jgi:hypothetical protein
MVSALRIIKNVVTKKRIIESFDFSPPAVLPPQKYINLNKIVQALVTKSIITKTDDVTSTLEEIHNADLAKA